MKKITLALVLELKKKQSWIVSGFSNVCTLHVAMVIFLALILTEFFYRRQWPTQNESQKCINSSLIYLWQSRSVRACSSFGLTTPNTFILERLPWSCTHDHWFHQENPLLWPLISVQKAFYPVMACYHHPGYTEHSVLFVDLACSQSKLAVIAVYTYGVACIIWCKKQ